MVRILYICGWLALITAVGVSALTVCRGGRGDAPIAARPAIEPFNRTGRTSNQTVGRQLSPLVQQAQAFAVYLNPPALPEQRPASPPVVKDSIVAEVPKVAPVNTSPKFKLHGISYRPAKPRESMALVWEPDVGHRWVREGSQLGHVIVECITPDTIEYRANQQRYIMAVEAEYTAPAVHSSGTARLAAKSEGRSKPVRTVSADTTLPREHPWATVATSEQTLSKADRPPMRRYRLGR